MPKLKGLLDTARTKLTGLLGDFPQGFNAGAVAGFPGWAGDMAYMADTARLALTGADQQAAPENYVGTTDYIAKQAGYPVPQTLSGQLGAAVGGLMTPGPGDLAKFAPLGAMFLGAKAKTAMPDVLEYAQAMDKMGKSADEIWQTTAKLGQPWFKGADGKWRFEVPDRTDVSPRFASALNAEGDDLNLPLVGALGWADESIRAYPDDLPRINVNVIPGEGGKYRGRGIDVGQFGGQSVLLHEVQHAIQQLEGHAAGGTAENASQWSPEFAAWARLRGTGTPEEEAAYRAIPKDWDAYQRLAGEAEARNVQARMNMTMDERIALPPWVTQDVPTDQQIVRFGDGPAMAIEDFAARRAGKAKPYKEAMGMDQASRMARAEEMGFTTDAYHGTADDVTAFDPAKFGSSTGAHSAKQGVWTVSDPKTAGGYAQYAANDAKVKRFMDEADAWDKKGNWDKMDEAVIKAEEQEKANFDNDWLQGQNVMKLKVRGKYLETDMAGAEFVDVEKDIKALINKARREGYDGVRINNLADDVGFNGRPATHTLTFDPKNIRSVNAKFDPSKRDSANLLAGGAAAAVGLGAMREYNREREVQ